MSTHVFTKAATGMVLGACLALSLGAGAAYAAEQARGGNRFDFDACDTNKDGMLSKAEYEAWVLQKSKEMAEKRFAAMDKNHDGSVTKEEMHEDAKARKEQWGKKRQEKQSKNN